MIKQEEQSFGFLRSILWPVHRSELKKVVSMLLLLFFLCMCYSVLRNVKDTVILTAKASGAEVIPFIKVWGMLPGALAATWVYTRLSRYFSRENVFYIIITGFLVYFLLFAFVIYPNSDQLHLTRLGDWLTQSLPTGFKGMIAIIRNWSFTSFYVIAELWSVIVLAVLYWGFTNDITGVNQAKRTYGILNIGSNIAPILGGVLALICSQQLNFSFFATTEDPWGQTLKQITCLIAILGTLSMGVFYWINRNIKIEKAKNPDEARDNPEQRAKSVKRLSMRESIRYIGRSKYLICVAMIVLGYNISINLTDVLWKEQLKRYFTNPNDMLAHMNQITIGIGLLGTVGGMLFSYIVQRWGWTFTAIITPALMLMMAIGFFGFRFCGDQLSALSMSILGLSPLACTVYFGSMQNCVSKAGKYSVFDASKELAFLPLDAEARLKGKAAIDGLGSGLGKSGASLTYQGFIIMMGSVALSTPYMAIILAIVLGGWIYSVFFVGKRFKEISAPQEEALSAIETPTTDFAGSSPAK